MLGILCADTDESNEDLKEEPRADHEDNLHWLARTLGSSEGVVQVVLIGGVSGVALRLRIAQSQARHDLSPSHWSHVMLLDRPSRSLGETRVWEVSLEPQEGFGFPPVANGLQEGRLGRYADGRQYPNIAAIRLPEWQAFTRQAIEAARERFVKQRAVLDAVDLMVRWLAYLWGAGRATNPLVEGVGVPSAAMLEVVFGAAGFDVTPGLESRSSCPEAIWQAAKWWHDYYKRDERPGPSGFYHVGHKLVPEPTEASRSGSAPDRPAAPRTEGRAQPRRRKGRGPGSASSRSG